MTPDQIRQLYDYNSWANRRLLDCCAALSEEQFVRDLGSSFRSVRDTLAHIMGAEWIWLERWHGRSHNALPPPADYFNLEAVRRRWEEIEQGLDEFVRALTATDLTREFQYQSTRGTQFSTPLWQMLQHLANHGTYHRGQVTTMLRQLSAKPVALDLIAFYRERAGQPLA